jgi:DNA-binding transcriptional ArsR family regulator
MTEPATKERVSSLRAVAHPVRLRMLSLLTGSAMSAAEIARELGITHANASYHLRTLAKAGQVVEAGEERIRGGVAKRYRYPWPPDARPGNRRRPRHRIAGEELQLYLRAVAEELVRRSGSLQQRGRSMDVDAEMWVTPQTWAEVFGLVQRAAQLIHAEAKPPRSPGTVHVNLTAFAFELADAGKRTRRVGGLVSSKPTGSAR